MTSIHDEIEEYLATLPHYFSDIGVGLGMLAHRGRHRFALEGEELNDFLRRCLHLLLAHGAEVHHTGSPSDPMREIELHYGSDTPDEIVEGVIADWRAMGGPDLEWGDFWFALPGILWLPKPLKQGGG